jgi:UDP-N-acetylglucosamine:LPS N-acetylglucosamine transferase
MKNILIIFNLLNPSFKFTPKFVRNFIKNYQFNKLAKLVKFLKKRYGNNLELKVIDAQSSSQHLKKEIDIVNLSDIRIKLSHSNYLKIKNKIISETKNLLISLMQKYSNLKFFNIEGLFIPRLLEFKFSNYFNLFLGQVQVIGEYIKSNKFENIIIFNSDQNSVNLFNYFGYSKYNFKQFNERSFNFILKTSKLLDSLKYISVLLGSYFKNFPRLLFNSVKPKGKIKGKKLLFVIHTKNQFNSVNPVYKELEKKGKVFVKYYYVEYFLRLFYLFKLIKFIVKTSKMLSTTIENNLRIKNDAIPLLNILMRIYKKNYFFVDSVQSFNFYHNLNKFSKAFLPDLVVVANDFNLPERVVINYLKAKKIDTFYIPHAAIPILHELSLKSNIKYYALGGESDKKYYMTKNIEEDQIKVVGIPRYEHFYTSEIPILPEVQDMFNNQIYNLEKKNPTILLTTNPIDDQSNRKIITTVVDSLKKLNLIENLIIKLHPSESGRIHRKITQELNVNPIIVKDYNILELIKSCDLLISQKSTTLLEAMIVGTPMILLDFINKEFTETSDYEFLDDKVIVTVKEQSRLTVEVQTLISNKNKIDDYKKKLNHFVNQFSLNDKTETPTKKISRYLKSILNSL